MVILDAMISISSKIRLDAMSKVISFSISDRYLDKIRSLYPGLTDNLAAKQFLTDRLDEGLSNSLDASLDDGLDGKLETMIQTRLDGLLDERLDATVGKLIGDLSERLARLESRLDDGLDDMEPLLKREREASIADHSPIPTGELSPSPSPPATEAIEPAIETAISEPIPKTHAEITKLLGLKTQSNLNYWIKNGIPERYQDRIALSPDGKKIMWIGD